MDQVERNFRKFTLDKLQALRAIAYLKESVASTVTLSGVLTKEGRELGGTLSSLTRTQVDGKPLMVAVGRSDEGILWRLNEEVAPKKTMRDIIEKILEENKSYRMQIDEGK